MVINYRCVNKIIFSRAFVIQAGLIFLLMVFAGSCGKKEEAAAPGVRAGALCYFFQDTVC